MSGEIITIIVSALVASIATPIGAWVGSRLMRAKYQAEVDNLRAEMKEKLAEVKSHELENVRKASDILMESIVPPLKTEIKNLRNDVQRLNKALERIWGCRHIDRCPVKFELLRTPPGGERKPDGGNGAGARDDTKRDPERGDAGGDHCAGVGEQEGDLNGD